MIKIWDLKAYQKGEDYHILTKNPRKEDFTSL